MKKVVPALAIALMAAIGGSSAAQAAVHIIDFSVGISSSGGGTLSYIPAGSSSLDKSSAFNFDGTSLVVISVGPNDNSSGVAAGDPISLLPSLIDYGTGSGILPIGTLIGNGPITKSWVGTVDVDGTPTPDTFNEILTDVVGIDRSGSDAISVLLKGMVSDSLGVFDGTTAFMELAATQVGGPGAAISVSLTNFAKTGTVPEPATWVMMALGFIGLGYAAVRRSSKDRSALAI